jgi:hypothetical protein
MWINDEVVRFTPGSHHFLLWLTSYTSIPTKDTHGNTVNTANGNVFECSNGPNADWNATNFVGGSQSPDGSEVISNMPPGVALKVPAGAVLMLDLHVLNATGATLNPDARINLYTVDASTVTTEAGIYFFYNPFIEVPPHASAAARMSCPVTSNITLINGQSHMHARGLGGVANLVDTATDTMIKQIYVSHDWVNVPVTPYSSPALTLTKGQSIDYQCNYMSQEDTTVYQGLKTTDEMCVFTGAYYPRDTKFEDCSTDGSFGGLSTAATYIGTGTTTCSAALTCIASGGNSLETLTPCIVDSCPKAGIPLTAVLDCEQGAVSGSCASMCGGGGSGCITCIESACGTEISACLNATCN